MVEAATGWFSAMFSETPPGCASVAESESCATAHASLWLSMRSKPSSSTGVSCAVRSEEAASTSLCGAMAST